MWSLEKIPHGPPDSKAVCAITAEAGIHTDTAKAYKAGCLQAAGGAMAGGSAIFGGNLPQIPSVMIISLFYFV